MCPLNWYSALKKSLLLVLLVLHPWQDKLDKILYTVWVLLNKKAPWMFLLIVPFCGCFVEVAPCFIAHQSGFCICKYGLWGFFYWNQHLKISTVVLLLPSWVTPFWVSVFRYPESAPQLYSDSTSPVELDNWLQFCGASCFSPSLRLPDSSL